MSPASHHPLSLIRQQLLAHLDGPTPELIDRTLAYLRQALDARAAFLARLEDDTLEIVAAQVAQGVPIEPGLRLPLGETFLAAEDEAEGGLLNIRDAGKLTAYNNLPMRQRFDIASYLGTGLGGAGRRASGTIAVLGKGPRVFTEADETLLLLVTALIAPRLGWAATPGNGQARTPASALRLASHDVKEPLAILRGYADMLSNNEVPADQMALVAERLATQSETLMRVADQVLLLSRLPLELAFTVRVSLGAVAQTAAARIRDRLAAAGMELRLREAGADRVQLMVKDDGPGMSADHLAELFGPLAQEQPVRGQGLGLYLLRRVAQAHGGRSWANSLEGKGTTFYLELPAASPDGNTALASATVSQSSA